MDVVTIIFYLVVAGFALYAAFYALALIWGLLPIILCLWGGIWLWNHGHDNVAVIVGIAAVPVEGLWLWLILGIWKEERSSGSDYSSSKPYNTKTAYDKMETFLDI